MTRALGLRSRSATSDGVEPLKILHVMPSLGPKAGGPAKAGRQMCEALARRGVDTTLFTTDLAAPVHRRWLRSPERLRVHDGHAHRVGSLETQYFRVRWPWVYAYSSDLHRELRRRVADFDLVHIHSIYLFPTWAASRQAWLSGVPYLIRPHGTLDPVLHSRRRLRKAVYSWLIGRRIFDLAAGIHYTSPEERDQAQPLGFTAPAFVVPLGLDTSEFASLPPRGAFRNRYPQLRDRRLVVFLGRLTPKKGLDLLASAFKSVLHRFPDAELVVAGPDDEGYGATVTRLLARAGIQDRTLMTGMVTGQEKLALLADADVWVLPSYGENFGLATLEALACGLPVVISDRVNIHHSVSAAGAGIVTPCDPDQIADAICRVLGDPELRARLSRCGPPLVEEQFNWDRSASALIEVYGQILDNRRAVHAHQ